MEINAQLNTFEGGMDLDTDITLIPKNKYREATNVRLTTDNAGTTGVLQNIEDISVYSSYLNPTETILGVSTCRYYDSADSKLKECGVIITKEYYNNTNLNNIWVVMDFDRSELTFKLIVSTKLKIQSKVSIVTNYESNDISEIYFTDGTSSIKVINLQQNYNTTKDTPIEDSTYFDLIPGSQLPPFKLTEIIQGSLPAGSVQYCYQLFQLNGCQTVTSSLSTVIPVISLNTSTSKNVNGEDEGDITNMGCRISTNILVDNRFQKIRIFAIRYHNKTSLPDIYIINECDLPTSSNGLITFNYDDTGNNYTSKLTTEEFNDLIPYTFTANSLAKLDNKLFASNIQEDTWDVDYDARVYRSNKQGVVNLSSSTTTNNIAVNMPDILNGNTVIPKDHDCINPSNSEMVYPNYVSQEYAYGYEETYEIRGGRGLNIKYRFITTDLIESDSKPVDMNGYFLPTFDLNLSCGKRLYDTIKLKCPETGLVIDEVDAGDSSRIRNYSDPYYVSNFLGYQRDETYRFGIVFYNEKNIPSPVHWIGDIRFPSVDIPGYEAFTLGGSVDGAGNYELVSHPLGIMFEVSNLDPKVKAYEIVRCERKLADRTVVTQGLLNKTVAFDDWGRNQSNLGEIDRRPTSIPTYIESETYRLVQGLNHVYDHKLDTDGLFDFVSADICFNKEIAEQLVDSNCKINPIFCISSTCKGPNPYGVSNGIPFTKIKDKKNHDILSNPFGHIDSSNSSQYDGGSTYDAETGGALKYYTMYSKDYAADASNYNLRVSIDIQDAKKTYDITPFVEEFADYKQFVTYIGNCGFINCFVGAPDAFGPHGINMAVYSTEMLAQYPGVRFGPNGYDLGRLTTTLLVNIKKNTVQYGGNNYFNRQNSIYVSTGTYKNVSDEINKPCFGGDTYLGVFDYANAMVFMCNDANKGVEKKRYISAYIPLESSVNVYLRSDDHFSQNTDNTVGTTTILAANIYYATEPGSLNAMSVQSKPMYSYNSAYSVQSTAKSYIQKPVYARDNQVNATRITCSESKTNNELTDSWTKFKFANYIDVDGQYGPVTNLNVFKNKLYYFQDSAVGVASVNDRSLIQDNNVGQLVLGTGGILTRFDYIVTLNGTSIINDKSIVNTDDSIYWYDLDKNVICRLGSGFNELSKIGKVQSHLTSIPFAARKDAHAFYDKKYNEIWFRIYDNSLVFNEQVNAFTSFYTHSPEWHLNLSNRLVTLKDSKCYLHNTYNVDNLSNENRVSAIKFVVNDGGMYTKVFDNQNFAADLTSQVSNDATDIIKNVYFETKTQQTTPINQDSIENREDTYRLSIGREAQFNQGLQELAGMTYAGRMRGKYLVCNYTFDCNDNKQFKLPYIKTTYRYSMV